MTTSNTSTEKILSLEGTQVLLVEDCPDQARLYLNFLKQAGSEVTLECNGESAVNAVRRSLSRFDSIVMDFQMPEMDGLLATENIRALGFDGPIVAVTAHSTDELRDSWYRAGCDAYLEKPVQKLTLIETLQQYAKAVSQPDSTRVAMHAK